MITIFNRALLFKDVNSEAAARVWSALRKEGIEIYEVWVRKTDLERAKEVCSL